MPGGTGVSERPAARSLSFTSEDMKRFAAASGDRSPLHTDPAFARRTAFGECIVYGGLETIAMLGVLPREALARVRTVRSLFPGAVIPGAVCVARAQARRDRPGEWEVRLTGRGKLLARVTVSPESGAPGLPDGSELLAAARASSVNGSQPSSAPSPSGALPAAGQEIVGAYRPGPELRALAQKFGAHALDPRLLEGIAWASNVVGSTIPGFDGLCASVSLVAHGPEKGSAMSQWIRIREYDERTDLVRIVGVLSDGAGLARCAGLIECFPFSPTPLADGAALGSKDALEPPRGEVAVVGASRGAGAALALALLGHGYSVHAIYSAADESAAELQRLAGPYAQRLTLHRADAADPEAMSELTARISGPLDGLALCAAPPPLPMSLVPESAAELAGYVERSISLTAAPLAALMPSLAREGAWLLFFSSAQLEPPVRDLPQFTAAKAAVEGLARWAAAALPSARVLVARVPRMRTDLANTPSSRRAAAAPEAVAASILERIADPDPEPGLAIIEPTGVEVASG